MEIYQRAIAMGSVLPTAAYTKRGLPLFANAKVRLFDETAKTLWNFFTQPSNVRTRNYILCIKSAKRFGRVVHKLYLCFAEQSQDTDTMEGDMIHINKRLIPLSWLYGIVISLRNYMFDWGIIKSKKYDIPIINVGNITAGGTGKTPFVEHLIRLLRKDYKTAVLSRGYMRRSRGYILAKGNTPIDKVGDEPWMIRQKFPDIYVAVDTNRRRGISRLMNDKSTRDVGVILLDDAFQHRYVKAGCNILLIDYHRMINYDYLLPAGRLREPWTGKERAHMVIVTKCPEVMSPIEYRMVSEALQLRPFQKLFYASLKYGKLVKMFGDNVFRSLKDVSNVHTLLVSGIGNPRQMEMDMRMYIRDVRPVTFTDHHYYKADDIRNIARRFREMPEPKMIVTTEKDATRLQILDNIPNDIKDAIWVLPIKVNIKQDKGEIFNDIITGYVRQNLRDSHLD